MGLRGAAGSLAGAGALQLVALQHVGVIKPRHYCLAVKPVDLIQRGGDRGRVLEHLNRREVEELQSAKRRLPQLVALLVGEHHGAAGEAGGGDAGLDLVAERHSKALVIDRPA